MSNKRAHDESLLDYVEHMEKSIESLKWTMTVTLEELQRDAKRLKKLVTNGEVPSTPETKVTKVKKPVSKEPLKTHDELTDAEKQALKVSEENGQYYHNNWKKAKTRADQDNAMRDCIAYLSVVQEKTRAAVTPANDDHFVLTEVPKENLTEDCRLFVKIESLAQCEGLVRREILGTDLQLGSSEKTDQIIDERIRERVVWYIRDLMRMVSGKKNPDYDYTQDSEVILSENAMMNGFYMNLNPAYRYPPNTYVLVGPFLQKSKDELLRRIYVCLTETLLNFIENKPLAFDGSRQMYHVQIVGDNLIKVKIYYASSDDEDSDDEEDDEEDSQ